MVVAGVHVAAWVVITLVAMRLAQLLLAGRSDSLSQAVNAGITFAIGH